MSCQGERVMKGVLGTFGLAVILWCAGIALAQPPGGQSGPPGGGRGPGQPPGGPGGPGGFPGGGGFMMPMMFSPTDLLRRPDVRKELELLDDQVQQLEALEQKTRDRMRELFPRPREPGQEGNREPRRDQGAPKPPNDFRQVFEQINKETRAEVAQILLPHQMTRLEQLTAQLRMQGGGMSLLGGEVARDIGVTDEQREQLRTKVEEIEREARKKEAEVRRQAREQVISLLTPEQQKKLREMIGEPFTFEMLAPPSFGGQPGGGPRGPERKN